MKKLPVFAILMVIFALASPGAAQTPITRSCDVGPLTGVYQEVRCPGNWDLTTCDLSVTYTVNLRGMTPPAMGVTSWTAVGLRRCSQTGTGCASVGWLSAGGPLSFLDNENDYEWDSAHPGVDPALDLDDKLDLQSAAGNDELSYDVLDPNRIQPPFGTYDSYGIWFDRDGVDPWQATSWGAVDGGTYNTNGVYDVSISYHAIADDRGTMLAEVNATRTGFYLPGNLRTYLPLIQSTQQLGEVSLPVTSAGSGSSNEPVALQAALASALGQRGVPPLYPAGKSIAGDLSQLQVHAWLSAPNASYGTVTISDLQVTGCLAFD